MRLAFAMAAAVAAVAAQPAIADPSPWGSPSPPPLPGAGPHAGACSAQVQGPVTGQFACNVTASWNGKWTELDISFPYPPPQSPPAVTPGPIGRGSPLSLGKGQVILQIPHQLPAGSATYTQAGEPTAWTQVAIQGRDPDQTFDVTWEAWANQPAPNFGPARGPGQADWQLQIASAAAGSGLPQALEVHGQVKAHLPLQGQPPNGDTPSDAAKISVPYDVTVTF
jgi:hypothetical protein